MELLRKIPGVFFYKAQQKALRGIPDLIICAGGRFIAWELKVGKNRPDKLQQHIMENIAKAHGLAWTVTPDNIQWSIEQIQKIVGEQVKSLYSMEFSNE